MTKSSKILVCCLLIMLLSGCWDSVRLSSRALVAGIGIDRAENGDIELTAQLIKPGALNPNSGSGGSSEDSVLVQTTSGRTVFDAVRQFSKTVSRKLYFEQNRILVIDQDVAQEGLIKVIDFFMRDHESRKRAFILVCKKSAKGFLSAKSDFEKIPATEVLDMMKNQVSTSQVAINDLHGLSIQLESPFTSPYAPLVCIQEKEDGLKKVVFLGTAVFKEDKLVGYLDSNESRGLNFLLGKVKSGVIVIYSPADNSSYISMELIASKTKLKPSVVDGEFIINLEVNTIVSVGDIEESIDIIDKKVLAEVKKRTEQAIENEINSCLLKLQKEFKTDIVGIGDTFYRRYPKQWSEFKNNWPDNFELIKINADINVQVEHTGIITDPLERHD